MTTITAHIARPLTRRQWFMLGATASLAAIVAVLVTQTLALALWPDIAAFKPLDGLPRSAIFTLIPAVLATALFAWLAGRLAQPERVFLRIALIVLIASFIPDYLIPLPDKTFLASTVAAVLHAVAAAVIVTVLILGYRRCSKN